MGYSHECERLRIQFKRSVSLPPLPNSALRLIRILDEPDASANALENVISTDPALAAKILRVANSSLAGFDTHVGSIRQAILRLGLEAVRNIALSFMVNSMWSIEKMTGCFDVPRFADHSLFVGVLSRYFFSRQQKVAEFPTAWTADEMLAAGILHELSSPLLAFVAPDMYERVFNLASRNKTSLEAAFFRIFEVHMGELAADACEAWGLPEVFQETLRYVEMPWMSAKEFDSIACIHYANFIAETKNHGLVPWETNPKLAPEIPDNYLLSPDEMEYVLDAVERHVSDLTEDSAPMAA